MVSRSKERRVEDGVLGSEENEREEIVKSMVGIIGCEMMYQSAARESFYGQSATVKGVGETKLGYPFLRHPRRHQRVLDVGCPNTVP